MAKSRYYILEIEGPNVYIWDSAVANQATFSVMATGALASISKTEQALIREAVKQVRADMAAAMKRRRNEKLKERPSRNSGAIACCS